MDDDRYRVAEIQLACPDGAAARWALICAGNNQWNAPSSKNFKPLSLGRIEVDSTDFWTDRFLSASSPYTMRKVRQIRSNT